MIDTHLHILPGVDDGPETLEESLSLAQALVQEGIHLAVATPHYNDVFPQHSAAEIYGRVHDIQRALDNQGIPLRLLAGHEALIKPGLVEDIQASRLATLNNSRYLLLELWNNAWIPETEQVIFELRASGIVPIIAHPERSRAIQQDAHRLAALLQQGVLTQLTASSLVGVWGKSARLCAEALLKKGLIHCIASDAHCLRKRPLWVASGPQRARELLGQAHVYQMIETRPAAIINNEVYDFVPLRNNRSFGKGGTMMRSSAWSRDIPKDNRWRAFLTSSPFPIVIVVTAISLLVGIVLGTLPPFYSLAVIGAIVTVIIIVLRQDELAIMIVIAVHLYIDWYWGLEFVAQIMELALLGIFFLGRSPRCPWVEPRALGLWILFLVLAIFPATRGVSLLDTLNYYFNIIFGSLTIFWLGTLIARNTASVRRLFKMLAGFGTFLAIHTIIQATTGTVLFATSRFDSYFATISNYALDTSTAHRAGSFLINPDSNGGFFAIMLFIPLGLFVESSSIPAKLFYLAQIFLMLLALLLTYSTGGWLTACVGIITFIAFVGYKRSRVQISLFIIVVTVVIMVFFPEQVNLQIQHASVPSEVPLRVAIWQIGIQVIRAFPLTGIGLGRYVFFERSWPYLVPPIYVAPAHPHNSYLEIAALAGIPVLIVFLALLAFTFWSAFRNWMRFDAPTRSLMSAGIAAVVALSVNSMANNAWTLIPLAAIGWLVSGIVSSPLLTKNLDRRGMKEKKQVSNKSSLNSLGEG